MFKNDSFIKGFLIGLALNAVTFGIVWVLVEKVGVALIKDPTKLYLLAAIPAILLMWYGMKKKGCVKMGMGVLLSVIVAVVAFFVLYVKL